ncbi:HAD family hydrolase [Paenibacillus humicola]|uniref:HAD family hydrolase n=1 Tax=Paenibacillus humicola TaxID=3110540 RepID=UPI00237C0A21|nr:HAD-IA family hydrolase [Paenibacillus humicola]
MIKAVIFDFDGLIIDTETCEMNAWRAMYEEHNAQFPEEVLLGRIGTRDAFDPFEELIGRASAALDKELLREAFRVHLQRLLDCEQARLGVEDYLRTARELGLHIGLASSSNRIWIEPFLERLGLRHYFDAMRTFDDVKNAKPDPELYQRVLADFGILPQEAIAFEDSVNGSLAAVRAGLHCVIVPNATTRRMTFPAGVFARLDSMAELPLRELIRSIGDESLDSSGVAGA